MASLMETLIDILQREAVEYENLLGLSVRKTPVIVAGNLDELAKITDEEQIVVSRINHIDVEVQSALKDIANVINKDVKTIKIKDLIRMLDKRPTEQQKLAREYDRLKDAAEKVAQINERNKELINDALEMVQFDLNILQAMKSAPETANYDKGAYNTGSSIGLGQGGFDAKQYSFLVMR